MKRVVAIATVLALGVLMATAAGAATYSFKATGNLPGLNGYNNGGIFASYLNTSQSTTNALAYRSLCASTSVTFSLGTWYDALIYRVDQTTNAKKLEVAYLVDKYLLPAATQAQNDALQSAVWNLWQGSPAPTALGASYITEATTAVLGGYTSTSAYFVELYDVGYAGQANHLHQPQFVKLIPEPVFFQFGAMMGLGGAGVFRLRRKA